MRSPAFTFVMFFILLITTFYMFQGDAPKQPQRELIQYCDSDYCTTAVGAFWAKQDSLDAARFFAGGQ